METHREGSLVLQITAPLESLIIACNPVLGNRIRVTFKTAGLDQLSTNRPRTIAERQFAVTIIGSSLHWRDRFGKHES
jgi:hypothetical protein